MVDDRVKKIIEEYQKDDNYFVDTSSDQTFYIQDTTEQKEWLGNLKGKELEIAREIILTETEMKKKMIEALSTMTRICLREQAEKGIFDLQHTRMVILDSITNYILTLFPQKEISQKVQIPEIKVDEIEKMLKFNYENQENFFNSRKTSRHQ